VPELQNHVSAENLWVIFRGVARNLIWGYTYRICPGSHENKGYFSV